MKRLLLTAAVVTALLSPGEDALERYRARRAAEKRAEAKAESAAATRAARDASLADLKAKELAARDKMIASFFIIIDREIMMLEGLEAKARIDGYHDRAREFRRTLAEVRMIKRIGQDDQDLRDEIAEVVQRATRLTSFRK